MGLGVANALNEITLVLFTTLAPSGAVACFIIGAVLLSGRISDGFRAALDKFLALPILVALVGLVASATHLGNPGNALYVLAGAGRSPLSNEVLAGVVFFGLVGSYWLYSFSQTRRVALGRAWTVLFMAAALAFLAGIAFAYQVDTIVTWANPAVPVNLVLNALVGGPLVALVALSAAQRAARGEGADDGHGDAIVSRLARGCLAVSAGALVANVVGYAVEGASTLGLSNSLVSAAQLVGHYPAMVALFAVLCAAGVVVAFAAYRRSGRRVPGVPAVALSAFLALCGIFVMRFAFYMSHMTVGVAF